MDELENLEDLDAFLSIVLFEHCKGAQTGLGRFFNNDNKKLAEFFAHFAGCYMRLPPTKKLRQVFNTCRLVEKYRAMHAAYARKDFSTGRVLEADLYRIGKGLNLSQDRTLKLAKESLKSIKAARSWRANYDAVKKAQAARPVTEGAEGLEMVSCSGRDPHAVRQMPKKAD